MILKIATKKTWFKQNIISVQDLLREDGTPLNFIEFANKYKNLNTNFLSFYQMISAIPKSIVKEAADLEINKDYFTHLRGYIIDDTKSIDLSKMKCKKYYSLLLSAQKKIPNGFRK